MANRWKGNIIAAAAATSSGTDYTGKANGAWGLNSQLQQKQGGLWAKGQTVPNAPTSVTATVANAQSVISFTAPTDNGGSAITSYTVTSSTGGITATGSASPITITGLTNGTAYTFTVTATNAIGTGTASSPSNSVTPMSGPAIGSALGGGFYAGQIKYDNGTTYNLIIAPRATGQSFKVWSAANGTISATSKFDGFSNTNAMRSESTSEMANFCNGLNIGTYTDWYVPAQDELEVLYYYLKPSTDPNSTSSGANPHAVAPEPINTNYTANNPTMTTAIAFATGGSEKFFGDYAYATSTQSTEASSSQFKTINSTSGALAEAVKTNATLFRVIRKIAV